MTPDQLQSGSNNPQSENVLAQPVGGFIQIGDDKLDVAVIQLERPSEGFVSGGEDYSTNFRSKNMKQIENSAIVMSDQEKSKEKSNNEVNTKPEAPFMFAGYCGAIIASLFSSLGIFCVRLMPIDNTFSGKTVALFFRGLMFTLLCSIAAYIQGSSLKVKRDEILVTFLRAFFGTICIFGAYLALNYISIGDSTALVFSSPVWTAILGYLILNEPFQWLLLIALPASLFGIILVAHPALIIGYGEDFAQAANVSMLYVTNSTDLFDLSQDELITNPSIMNNDEEMTLDFDKRWIGIGMSLTTSICVSLVYIVLKFRKSTSIQATTFWFGFLMVVTSIVIMCFTGFGDLPSTRTEWILLISNGIFSWLGQSMVQWALIYAEASICSVIRTLDVVLAFILSSLFLDDEILWTSIAGSTIISIVVVLIILNNWLSQSRANDQEQVLVKDPSLRPSEVKIEVKDTKPHSLVAFRSSIISGCPRDTVVIKPT